MQSGFYHCHRTLRADSSATSVSQSIWASVSAEAGSRLRFVTSFAPTRTYRGYTACLV